jgi:putative sterol carrier protein
MSAQQVRDIEQYFPTKPWLERYQSAIQDSEAYDEDGADWGVDWKGAFIFHIQDIPVADHTIADLPEEIGAALEKQVRSLDEADIETLVAAAPDAVADSIAARDGDIHERSLAELRATTLAEAPERVWPELRTELPEVLAELLTQLEESVVDDDTVYAYLDVYDGGCREVDVIQSPDERDHGFRIIGEYDSWKELVGGEAGIINMLMAGEFDVDGDMQKILQYSDGAVTLTDIAADLETRFIL